MTNGLERQFERILKIVQSILYVCIDLTKAMNRMYMSIGPETLTIYDFMKYAHEPHDGWSYIVVL